MIHTKYYEGTLYISKEGTKFAMGDTTPHDDDLIVEFSNKEPVPPFDITGLVILNAQAVQVQDWESHPDRSYLPKEMYNAVLSWLKEQRQLGPKTPGYPSKGQKTSYTRS